MYFERKDRCSIVRRSPQGILPPVRLTVYHERLQKESRKTSKPAGGTLQNTVGCIFVLMI